MRREERPRGHEHLQERLRPQRAVPASAVDHVLPPRAGEPPGRCAALRARGRGRRQLRVPPGPQCPRRREAVPPQHPGARRGDLPRAGDRRRLHRVSILGRRRPYNRSGRQVGGRPPRVGGEQDDRGREAPPPRLPAAPPRRTRRRHPPHLRPPLAGVRVRRGGRSAPASRPPRRDNRRPAALRVGIVPPRNAPAPNRDSTGSSACCG